MASLLPNLENEGYTDRCLVQHMIMMAYPTGYATFHNSVILNAKTE